MRTMLWILWQDSSDSKQDSSEPSNSSSEVSGSSDEHEKEIYLKECYQEFTEAIQTIKIKSLFPGKEPKEEIQKKESTPLPANSIV